MVAVEAVVVRVTTTVVCALPEGTVGGANEHADLAGRFEQASVTVPLIPGLGVNVICSVADPPAVVVTDGCIGARVNPGFTTVTLAVV